MQAQQQQDTAGQQLELIYAKIIGVNEILVKLDARFVEQGYFTADDLALIRWAFGIQTH